MVSGQHAWKRVFAACAGRRFNTLEERGRELCLKELAAVGAISGEGVSVGR